MLFPVRCFTCGKIIADKYEEYRRRVERGESPGKVLDDLGIKRYCCRRIFLTHVDVTDEMMKFSLKGKI